MADQNALDFGAKFKQKYGSLQEIQATLNEARDIRDVANLYYVNAELIETDRDTKQLFRDKKDEVFSLKSSAA